MAKTGRYHRKYRPTAEQKLNKLFVVLGALLIGGLFWLANRGW
jgi:hypothetical protein